MSFLSGKKLLLVGFIVVLLIAIPVTVYLVQQQQKTKSSAEAATTLSLAPVTQTAKVGDTATFEIWIDPASINQVQSVKVVLTYDSTKLATTEGSFTVLPWPATDGTTFTPSVLLGPNYTPGTITTLMTIGGSPQNVITTRTKIATVSFKALAKTDGVPTQIAFSSQSQALSQGGSTSTDEAGANIISNTSPGSVNITDESVISPTVTFTPTPTLTVTPTPTGIVTLTPTVTSTPTSGLTCTALTLDGSSTGVVPFSVNMTATGNSTGSAITNVSFDYGDGQTQDVADSGGIGTSSISVLTTHTYATSGIFNASATLTDENGNVSVGGCVIAIIVNNATNSTLTPTSTLSPTIAGESPSPLPPTGPTGLITVGLIGIVISFIGVVLLLAL